jgi:hypothetical protein
MLLEDEGMTLISCDAEGSSRLQDGKVQDVHLVQYVGIIATASFISSSRAASFAAPGRMSPGSIVTAGPRTEMVSSDRVAQASLLGKYITCPA